MIFNNYDILEYISSFLFDYQIILLAISNKIILNYLHEEIIKIKKKKEEIENILGFSLINYLGGIKYILNLNNLKNENFDNISIYSSKGISYSLNKYKPFVTFKLGNYNNLDEKYLIIIYMNNYYNWSLINLNSKNQKILKNKPFNNFGNIISNGYHYNSSIKKNIQVLIKNQTKLIKINDTNNGSLELVLL